MARGRHSKTFEGVNRRKVLAGLGTAGFAGLAGCSGGGDPTTATPSPSGGGDGDTTTANTTTADSGEWPDLSGQEVHFLVDETSDAFRNFFSNVASDFNEATGGEVRMEYQATGGDAEDRLAQLLQAGDPPEILLSSVSQSAQLAAQGLAAPVNDAYNAVVDQFGEPTAKLEWEGDQYMMPFGSNIGMFWYRTDIYNEAPTTWETLLSEGQRIEEEEDDIHGTALLRGSGFCTELQLMAYAYSNEAFVCENNGGTDINVIMDEGSNRDNWVEVLEFMQDLDGISGGNEDIGCGGSSALANENAAHAWWIGVRQKNQAILQERPFAEDIAACQQPGPGTEAALTNALNDGLITYDGADNEAAQTYMEFFAQPEYFTQIMAITPLHIIPPFPGIFEVPEVAEQIDNLPDVWSDHDIQAMKSAKDNAISLAQETEPTNPFGGAIFGSRLLSDVLYDATIEGNEPEAVIDEYAPQIQQAVDDARSSL